MSSNTVGILIIIGIIIIGIATGGKIFGLPAGVGTANSGYSYQEQNTVPYNPNSYPYQPPQSPLQPSSGIVSVPKTSAYTNKVRISAINNQGSFDENITLEAYLNNPNEKVNITGWKFVSTVTGNQLIIGGAANVPISGYRDETPVFLSDGMEAIVIEGISPVGTSFRINKCTGFFSQDAHYSPSLPLDCPAVSVDAPPLSNDITNECLDYIANVPRCQTFNNVDNALSLNIGAACTNFLTTRVNYNSCVANHRNDPDFLKNQWRIFSNTVRVLWLEKRDTIELIDNSGQVVDVYRYGYTY